MSVIFNFNTGESKRIDKPLANLLEAKGLGTIAVSGAKPIVKEVAPPETKEDKVIKRRAKK